MNSKTEIKTSAVYIYVAHLKYKVGVYTAEEAERVKAGYEAKGIPVSIRESA